MACITGKPRRERRSRGCCATWREGREQWQPTGECSRAGAVGRKEPSVEYALQKEHPQGWLTVSRHASATAASEAMYADGGLLRRGEISDCRGRRERDRARERA